MKKRNKTLEWIRGVRDKMYEDWRNDPIGYGKKRKKSLEEFKKFEQQQQKKAALK